MLESDARFAAYVRLSRLITGQVVEWIKCRHTAEPMKPAPAVTNALIPQTRNFAHWVANLTNSVQPAISHCCKLTARFCVKKPAFTLLVGSGRNWHLDLLWMW